MSIQNSSNKSVATNTNSSTKNINKVRISDIVSTIGNSINIVKNATLEEYDLDAQTLTKEGTLNKDNIDFSRIATSSSNVKNENFITIKNTKYWGDTGELTYKIRDDGTVAIMENGIVLGFTDLQGITVFQEVEPNLVPGETKMVEEKNSKSNLVPGETIMVKEKEETPVEEASEEKKYMTNLVPGEEPFSTFNGYEPEVFVVKPGEAEYEEYLAGQKMKEEVQDIFERNGMKVDIIYTYRPHNSGIGYANDRSHHRDGEAVDIVPRDGDFVALRNFLLHNEEMVAYLKENDLGVIDESHACVNAATGGPTEHFHIGPDNMAKRMYKGWEYLETYCDDVRNATSEEEIELLKQQMRDRLLSWDFREYEMQAFFEDAQEMLESN